MRPVGNESAGGPSPGAAHDADPIVRDVEALRERLLYFAARRVRSFADAEDVAQETIRRAIEALQAGRIEKPASLPSFLFQTALHVCQRRYRSAGRETRALRRFGASSPESAPDDPLGSLISRERRSQVRQALERLETEDREVLTLTFGDGLPTADIAQKLGTSEGNVRVRRHRALGRLAALLGVTRGSGREP
jgi:RNA polymerase sigma-70 factor (ECF subfamily)